MTTVTAHGLGLPAYDPAVIDGSVLPVDVVLAACDDLLGRSRARARRARVHAPRPRRRDRRRRAGLGATSSARVRDEVAAAGGRLTEVVTSEHDILDGIAWSIATR